MRTAPTGYGRSTFNPLGTRAGTDLERSRAASSVSALMYAISLSTRSSVSTTPLRNVELTGPYGHDGSIASLREFVEHYSESDLKLLAFDPTRLESPLRLTLVNNAADILLQRDTLLAGVVLTDALVDNLMAYMGALTDDAARDLSRSVPVRVPSGLKVDRP